MRVVHRFVNSPVDKRTWLWIKPPNQNQMRDTPLARQAGWMNDQTKEQAPEQAEEQAGDRSADRSDERTDDRKIGQPDGPISGRADEPMDDRRTVKVSKYLSKRLRHQPERIGLTLGEGGWVEIDTLIAAARAHGFRFTREELDHVVAHNDKRRFAVEGTRIRASQGHSVEIDL